ncbi:MAG: hypothetical protein IJ358_03440 [Clostridia bacterium]|nr:hypothetical protein [Clostridia bacterium]
MITDKNEAIRALKQDNVRLREIDKDLLRDKDVIVAYMQAMSSNRLICLSDDYPITLDAKGMIDNEDFVMQVINYLDAGYSKIDVDTFLKISATRIIKSKLKLGELSSDNEQEIKDLAKGILIRYRDAIKKRDKQLLSQESTYSKVCDYIRELDVFEDLIAEDEQIAKQIGLLADKMQACLNLNEKDAQEFKSIVNKIQSLLVDKSKRAQKFESYVMNRFDDLKEDFRKRTQRRQAGFSDEGFKY